jgi:hypothetical protein
MAIVAVIGEATALHVLARDDPSNASLHVVSVVLVALTSPRDYGRDLRPARRGRLERSLKSLNVEQLELAASFRCTTVQDVEQLLLGLGSYRMREASRCEHDFGGPTDESKDVVVSQYVRRPTAGRDDALPECMSAPR